MEMEALVHTVPASAVTLQKGRVISIPDDIRIRAQNSFHHMYLGIVLCSNTSFPHPCSMDQVTSLVPA